jgi:succinate dehydrogenase / fumarate reductase cytochrome b subunit
MSAAQAAPISGVGGFLQRAATSSLGAKIVMAVTGLVFYAWLALHLLGNLGVFAGREFENHYAHFLLSNPEILWGQRLLWMTIFPIHILSGIRLAALNRAARPEAYASKRSWRQATLASRTMAISGLVVLGFFCFHLFHFTWVGVANTYFAEEHLDALGQKDVYGMVLHAFANPLIAAFYAVGVSLVGFHLSHGLWSGVQSLGLNGRKWTPFAKKAGFVLALATGLAFASIPVAVLLGVIHDTNGPTAGRQVRKSLQLIDRNSAGEPNEAFRVRR